MAYNKDLPPAGATPVASRAYLERELTKIQLEFGRVNELVNGLVAALAAGGVASLYLWSDSLVMDDPGTGIMRANDVQLQSTTQFAVSALSATNAASPFGILDPGDVVVVVNETADVQEVYTLDAVPVLNNDTWWLFDVTHQTGQANNPATGAIMSFIWFPISEIT